MMEFRIADTFTDSLARLTGEEQKAVKTTAFDLQLNPNHPSLQFHKLAKAKDPNFWSIRVSRDVRLIVHKTGTSLLLCYVNHHDEAYQWAERRKVETHPKTGAAQLVEIRERVQEIAIPKYVEVEAKPKVKPPLFSAISEDQLLAFGVPREWLGDARNANEDSVLDLAEHLPAEAAEALLNLATGGVPRTIAEVEPSVHAYAPSARLDATAKMSEPTQDAFNHPDAQRRFRTISNQEELERAFEYPWEKWTIFLHPAQRQLVERDYSGPARISGSAGTGKTIVALHRSVHLARANPETRVLLTTFSDTLANAVRSKLRLLISNEPRLGERIEVHDMNSIGRRLHEVNLGKLQIASGETIRQIIEDASNAVQGNRFSLHFLRTEWEQVVDGWQLDTWEAYRDVSRLGRKTRLKEAQRALLWSIFEDVRSRLRSKGVITYSGMFNRLASHFEGSARSPFDFVVVDEAQDVSIAQLRFLAALGAGRPNKLFFAGDLGQRIGAQVIAGVRGKELDDARSLGVSDVLAIDDDKAIENFRLVDAIADTVGGDVAAKLIAKVRQSGSFGYTAVLPETAAAKNPTVKITRVRAQPDPSKLREFADDVRDGKFVLPIGRRMPLRDAAEAHVLGEKGGIGKILLLAPDSKE
jgi:mRNA-degrading endonuclease RelE of RelBE toxin-antitoxin system